MKKMKTTELQWTPEEETMNTVILFVIECNVEYEDYTIFVHELSIK